MSRPHDLLIVEHSSLHEGLFRFGRADAPRSAWGLIQRNAIGGFEVVKPQDDVSLSDAPTALCLVAGLPKGESRVEYDLEWRDGEETVRQKVLFDSPVAVRGETLGERAARRQELGERDPPNQSVM